LIGRAQRGDRQALELLIDGHRRLVARIAGRYRCQGFGPEDLIQEGVLGLIVAVQRFDVERGYRLSTYATWWIREVIGRAIELNGRLIHIPLHVASDARRLSRLRDDHQSRLGRPPTDQELAKMAGLPEERVSLLLSTLNDPVSLDTLIGVEQEAPLLETLVDPEAPDPEREVLRDARRQEVRRILDRLSPRERLVLEGRLGLDGQSSRTLESLSQELQLSRERVRQIEAHALRKLRAALDHW
jgi:RNA polymerase sigma factor (sigma-70 family)